MPVQYAMSKPALTVATALVLGLGLFGCDGATEAKQADAEASASLQANTTIAAKDFELATVVELVEREDVRDAESLEALINAEDSTIQVDVDSDGQRDFIQVHEVTIAGDARATLTADAKVDAKLEAEADPADGALTVAGKDGQTIQFELRVVPSSKVSVEAEAEAEVETVVVANVEIELHEAEREVVVAASYAPTVVVVADVEVERRYEHRVVLEHRHDHLVVVGAPFLAWVWIDVRPVYVGHVHLPPGQAKKLGLSWHHGGHGHHAGHGGNKGHVKVKGGGHGGPSKVHVKSKGSGSGGMTKVKIKGGHGGGGKVHVKSKGGGGGKGKH